MTLVVALVLTIAWGKEPAPLANISALAAGKSSTCALTGNGEVWCWGSGFLGGPKPELVEFARKIPNLKNIVQISAGAAAYCAIDIEGMVWCWGTDKGNGFSTTLSTVFAENAPEVGLVLDLPPATSVSVGGKHACALTNDGDTYCWGSPDENLSLGRETGKAAGYSWPGPKTTDSTSRIYGNEFRLMWW
jgi:alpha-tubulin suppressor-like RCC1 family protein